MEMKALANLTIALALLCSVVMVSCAPQPTPTKAPTEAAAASPTPAPEKQEFRVALVHYGTFADKGWGQGAYEGLLEAEEDFDLEVATNESVPVGEWEATFRDYAARGYDLVLGTDEGMCDAALSVAEEYEDSTFCILAGRCGNGKNVASLAIAEWQEGYLGGTLMAHLTESKKIGFIGGADHPIIVAVENGMRAAAAEQDPEVEVMASYCGSWTDVEKGKELASAMIDAGADVIMTKSDAGNFGALSSVEDRDVLGVASPSGDYCEVAPNHVVFATRAKTHEAIYYGVSSFVEGKLEPKVYDLGAAEEVVDMVWCPGFEDKYPELVELGQQALEDLAAGRVENPEEQVR
jgi:basic membrane protein A